MKEMEQQNIILVEQQIISMQKDIDFIKEAVKDMKESFRESKQSFVTKDQFLPVKLITYGLVAVILMTVLSSMINK